ncbi:pyridoxamine 5'-phosphate oxidase family protein [Thermaurantiacus sp.]
MAAGLADERFSDLATAEAEVWKRLVRASRDRRSPWHTPVVATIGADGAPRARVMVLRACDPAAFRLRLHTDARTAKVEELAAEPRLSLVFYDAAAKLQLRLEGRGRIETRGDAADAAWAATRPFSRRCYTAPIAPGSWAPGPVSGLPRELEGREPTLEESAAGRAHFAILEVEALALEFLYLAVTGHRRGRWIRVEDGAGESWEGRWLVP